MRMTAHQVTFRCGELRLCASSSPIDRTAALDPKPSVVTVTGNARHAKFSVIDIKVGHGAGRSAIGPSGSRARPSTLSKTTRQINVWSLAPRCNRFDLGPELRLQSLSDAKGRLIAPLAILFIAGDGLVRDLRRKRGNPSRISRKARA
jgi:hypothetical protein